MVEWKIKGLYKADPELIYDEITSIGDSVKPAEIVEYARNEETELHKLFTWDDTIAAERYREEEARRVVRNLVLVRKEIDDKGHKNKTVIRAIVSTNERNQEYTTIQRVVENKDSYSRLLAAALAELQHFKKKYESLSGDLEVVFEAISQIAS